MGALLSIVDTLFTIYMIMIFIKILSSWIPEMRNTKFIQFIAFYTDPYLNLFRKIIPPLGVIDLSPIVAFFCLGILEQMVKYVIANLFL